MFGACDMLLLGYNSDSCFCFENREKILGAVLVRLGCNLS